MAAARVPRRARIVSAPASAIALSQRIVGSSLSSHIARSAFQSPILPSHTPAATAAATAAAASATSGVSSGTVTDTAADRDATDATVACIEGSRKGVAAGRFSRPRFSLLVPAASIALTHPWPPLHHPLSAAPIPALVRFLSSSALAPHQLHSTVLSGSAGAGADSSSSSSSNVIIEALPPSVPRAVPDPGESLSARVDLAGSEVVFETGRLARLASGAVVVGVGDTKVLVTAVASHDRDASRDFLPLMVDYRERQYVMGRIPNTYMRREGAPKEREILCARIIDRSIRPLFPKGFFYDTQITASVLSSDQEQDPDVLAVNAASAALCISDIPWNGPIGCVRVGRIDGQFVVNPSMTQLASSDLSLVYACTQDHAVMMEVQAREISNEDMAAALHLAHAEAAKLIPPQLELAEQARQEKRQAVPLVVTPAVMERVRGLAGDAVTAVLTNALYSKQDRGRALSKVQEDVAEVLLGGGESGAAGEEKVEEGGAEGGDSALAQLPGAMEKLKREVIRDAVLGRGSRADGRGLEEVRQVACEAGVLNPLHGSSLFSRGNTQVLCTVTLGPPDDAQRVDSLTGVTQKRFMVHYSFPPFSVNEVRSERGGLNRREVGHGTLAEKALLAVFPDEQELPYSVRVTSEVMSSDGSSSMATVCGASLALMDAGVGVREHVAGISMGLVTDVDPSTGEIKDYRLLTDILGLEDYLGDMDFKIAGTRRGITAIQLDIKLPGVPLPVLCAALDPALAARSRIIEHMEKELAGPRLEHSATAPRFGTVAIDRDSIGRLIGPQGSTIKQLQRLTGSRIQVSNEGSVSIFARDSASFQATRDMVEEVVGKEVEVGGTYTGVVSSIRDFGAFVELEGGRDGLLHISEIEHYRVSRVEDVLKVGDTVTVSCISRDARGNVKLSRKALIPLRPSSDSPSSSTSSSFHQSSSYSSSYTSSFTPPSSPSSTPQSPPSGTHASGTWTGAQGFTPFAASASAAAAVAAAEAAMAEAEREVVRGTVWQVGGEMGPEDWGHKPRGVQDGSFAASSAASGHGGMTGARGVGEASFAAGATAGPAGSGSGSNPPLQSDPWLKFVGTQGEAAGGGRGAGGARGRGGARAAGRGAGAAAAEEEGPYGGMDLGRRGAGRGVGRGVRGRGGHRGGMGR